MPGGRRGNLPGACYPESHRGPLGTWREGGRLVCQRAGLCGGRGAGAVRLRDMIWGQLAPSPTAHR